jgi:hypothetical protein
MSAVRALDVAIKIERAILGRAAGEAKAGPTLSELIAASWSAPPLPVPTPAAPIPPPAPAPPAADIVPPALAPRIYGEN